MEQLFSLKRKTKRVKSKGPHGSQRSQSRTEYAQKPREAPSASVESGSEDDQEDSGGEYSQPSAEYLRGGEQAQPYGSPGSTSGRQARPSSTAGYPTSPGSRRPSSAQYHPRLGQWSDDEPREYEAPGAHLLAAESSPEAGSLEHGLRDLHLADGLQSGGEHYTHSPPVPTTSSSLEASTDTVPAHQLRNLYIAHPEKTEASSFSQDHDPTQDTAGVEYLVTPHADSASEYHEQPDDIMSNTSTYQPQNLDATQPEDAAQYYPIGQLSDSLHSASTHPSQNFESAQPEQTTQLYSVAEHPDPTCLSPAQSPAQLYHSPPKVTDESRVVRGTPGRESEKLDPSYQVRTKDYKRFFRIGRVFITLWTDQLGQNAKRDDPTFLSEVKFGEMVHTKVRRFVIVRVSKDQRSVTCLPVTSYGGTGVKKRGIDLSEHGFIYSKRKPEKVDGLRSKALKVVLSPRAESLQDPSLIHYGKVYTVETNVKVKEIGKLDSESEKALLHYFKKVFSDVDTDLRGPDMTPRATAAALVGIGAGLEKFSQYPVPPQSLSSAIPQSDFNSTSTPAGFPPPLPAYGTSGGFQESREPTGYSMYQQPSYAPQASFPSSYNGGYGPSGYKVSIAPGRTLNGPTAYTQTPATSNFYPHRPTLPGPVATGGTYSNYQLQGTQAGLPPTAHQFSGMNAGSAHDFGHGVAGNPGMTQDYVSSQPFADNRWGSSPSGTVGEVAGPYPLSPNRDDSVAAEKDSNEDIDLLSGQPVPEANEQESKSKRQRRKRPSRHW